MANIYANITPRFSELLNFDYPCGSCVGYAHLFRSTLKYSRTRTRYLVCYIYMIGSCDDDTLWRWQAQEKHDEHEKTRENTEKHTKKNTKKTSQKQTHVMLTALSSAEEQPAGKSRGFSSGHEIYLLLAYYNAITLAPYWYHTHRYMCWLRDTALSIWY